MKRSPMKRRTKSLSSKRKYDPAEVPARRAVTDRSGGDYDARVKGWCEVRISSVCLGRENNFQHRKNDGQGGEYSASNGLAVCGTGTTGCHGYIHANPEKSVEMGWTVKEAFDPSKKPVYGWFGEWPKWVYLDNDGGYDELGPDEVLDLGVKVA